VAAAILAVVEPRHPAWRTRPCHEPTLPLVQPFPSPEAKVRHDRFRPRGQAKMPDTTTGAASEGGLSKQTISTGPRVVVNSQQDALTSGLLRFGDKPRSIPSSESSNASAAPPTPASPRRPCSYSYPPHYRERTRTSQAGGGTEVPPPASTLSIAPPGRIEPACPPAGCW
jgi:hypothetical protein